MLGNAVVRSVTQCVMKLPKTLLLVHYCQMCGVLPILAALYCVSAAGIAFYGASKL